MEAAISFPVWATTAWPPVTDPRRAGPAGRELDAEITAMGDARDRFRPGSELSRLNTRPGRPSAVSPPLAEPLGHAPPVGKATDGAVDPTAGGALFAAGHGRDMAEVRRRRSVVTIDIRPGGGRRSVRPTHGESRR